MSSVSTGAGRDAPRCALAGMSAERRDVELGRRRPRRARGRAASSSATVACTASRHAGSTSMSGSGCVVVHAIRSRPAARADLLEERPRGRRRPPRRRRSRGPAIASRSAAASATVRAIGPFVAFQLCGPRRPRHAPARRLDAEQRRTTPTGCGSSRRRRSPARRRRARPRPRRPRRPTSRPGVRSVSHGLRAGRVRGGLGRRARAELGRVRLAEDHEAGAPDARDDLVVAVGDAVHELNQ